MDLFLREAADRIGADDVLAKIGALMDWSGFSPILKRGLGWSGEGPAGYEPQMHFSADPDACWVRKGAKSTPGYKAFARTDEEGFVDKVHTTPANRASLRGKHRGGQCLGTMKRLFGLHRTRYFGRAKTHAQPTIAAMAATGQNLLKAANKITLNPQTPARKSRQSHKTNDKTAMPAENGSRATRMG